jgi:hypothetical protein
MMSGTIFVLAGVATLVVAQSPGLKLVRSFSWSSLGAVLMVVFALLPLKWSLMDAEEGTWRRRLCVHPGVATVSVWAGICLLGIVGVTAGGVLAYSLERIVAEADAPSSAYLLLLEPFLVLSPLAALALGVAAFETYASRVFVWCGIWTASFGWLGISLPVPLDRMVFFRDDGFTDFVVLGSALLGSTVGGLLVSLVVSLATSSRNNAHRHPR